jgi:predicted ATPase
MTPPPSITGPDSPETTIFQAWDTLVLEEEPESDSEPDITEVGDDLLASGRELLLPPMKPLYERWRTSSSTATSRTADSTTRTSTSTASTSIRSDPGSEPFQPVECPLRERRDSSEIRRSLQRRLQGALYRRNFSLESKLEVEARRRLQDPHCKVKPFVVVSGNPGSGKVRFSRSIRPLVEEELGGYFVTGRFDQMQSPTPYPAFVEALEDFLKQVVARGPHEVARVQRAILDVEGLEASLLLRFLPCLKTILGDEHNSVEVSGAFTEAASATPSSGAILRFMYMFGNVFRSVSSVECPLVLVVDSLHYCDTISSDIMATVMVHEPRPGFMVIGTLEADKVPTDSMLSRRLIEIAQQGSGSITCADEGTAMLPHLALSSLDEAALLDALRRTFHTVDDGAIKHFASAVHRHTAGDPLFVSELVCALYEAQLLSFDPTSEFLDCNAGELEEILASLSTLESLLCSKISSLSSDCRELLQVASCLGSVLDPTLIEYALGRPVWDSIDEALQRGGLLECEETGPTKRFRFVNGCTQQASNLLIPKDDRQLYHLEMGRRIWRRLDETSTEEHFFQVLSLLRVGQVWIRRPKERQAVAILCLNAGIKAARSSAYLIANEHLTFGIQVLGTMRWREYYDLSLSLHNAAAEVAVCTGNVDAIDLHLNSVLLNARQYQDTMQARVAKFYSFGMQAGRYRDAMAEGIYLLSKLGMKFPQQCSTARLLWELISMRRLLNGKSDQFFMRLPALADAQKRFCLQVLTVMYQYSLFSRPDLVPLTILRMMKITVLHGSSEFASTAIANYGMLCIATSRDIEMGMRFGKLAMALFDRDGTPEFLPRVHSVFYGHIYTHKRPITEVLRPLAKAYRIGIHMGDIQGAFLCANLFCIQSLEAGVRLTEVEPELANLRSRLESGKQQSLLNTVLPLAQTVHEFLGKSDPIANLVEMQQVAVESGLQLDAVAVIYCRLAIAWIYRDFSDASLLMDCVNLRYYDAIPPGAPKMGMLATVGMYAVGAARIGLQPKRTIRVANSMIRRLRFYASHEPSNSQPRLHLLQAEVASYHSQNSRARQKYLSAIALSASTQCRHVCANANECYARHLYRLCENDAAKRQESMNYFLEACRIYEDWGATSKCQRLKAEMNELFPGHRPEVVAVAPKRPSLLLRASDVEFTSIGTGVHSSSF